MIKDAYQRCLVSLTSKKTRDQTFSLCDWQAEEHLPNFLEEARLNETTLKQEQCKPSLLCHLPLVDTCMIASASNPVQKIAMSVSASVIGFQDPGVACPGGIVLEAILETNSTLTLSDARRFGYLHTCIGWIISYDKREARIG